VGERHGEREAAARGEDLDTTGGEVGDAGGVWVSAEADGAVRGCVHAVPGARGAGDTRSLSSRPVHQCGDLYPIEYGYGEWWLLKLERDVSVEVAFCPWCGLKLGQPEAGS
jgi:hypothetical protein